MTDDLEEEMKLTAEQKAQESLLFPKQALARAAIAKNLGRREVGRLRAGTLLTLVVRVPSAAWVEPISREIAQMVKEAVVVAAGEGKLPADLDLRASNALQMGSCLVGVSHAPDRLLPKALRLVAQKQVAFSPIDMSLAIEAMRKCMLGNLPPHATSLDVSTLDFDELAACLTRGGRKTEAVKRMRTAIERLAPRSQVVQLPALEAAVEYGSAREWGMALAQDIADLKAGRITWRDVDRGALLWGPPGTGKTTFAHILAEACRLPLILGSVAQLFKDSNGYLDGVVKAQQKLFDRAASAAPAILFLDEINALPNPATMSSRGRDWWMPVVNDFYMLLDSAMNDRQGVIVIGATNFLSDIAEPILRPGRLERAIFIGPPNAEGLLNILRTHLAGDLSSDDLTPLSEEAVGATGAQAMEWVRAARRAARREGRGLLLSDLKKQLPTRPAMNGEQRARVATHEAGHALLGILLRPDAVEYVSIKEDGNSGGHMKLANLNSGFITKQELENHVAILLGGRLAEEEVYGDVSAGAGGTASSDLALATELVAVMCASVGMGGSPLWLGEPQQALHLVRADPTFREAVTRKLDTILGRARLLVQLHRAKLLTIAAALEERKVLSRNELVALSDDTGERAAA